MTSPVELRLVACVALLLLALWPAVSVSNAATNAATTYAFDVASRFVQSTQHDGRATTMPGTTTRGDADAARTDLPTSPGAVRFVSGAWLATKADAGLASRGLRPAAGTRVRPPGVPEGWRVRPTRGDGGTWYYDPSNKGNAVRVMQGDPKSPFPNSQAPYVRWQRNGHPLDAGGNILPSKLSPDAHIPLSQFKFRPDLFG